jgi:adenylate kinase family enzyme
MDSNVREINKIKYQVKQLIKDNLYREVTPETKHSISGIYMIYIDHFTSEKVVPIYIGQAKDIQRRYKQHLSEILALNRLSNDEYNKYFFSKSNSFYEGKFKASKFFKYMLENDCTLQDFRMIILEEVEVEYLDKKEQEYFQRLLPSFFGFNQMNSFLKQLKLRFSNSPMSNGEIDDYLSILLEDIKGIHSYYDKGFTRFNFEHSIPENISKLLKNKELLDNDILLKFEEVKLSLYELCKRYIPNFEEIHRLREKKNKLYEDYKIAKDECYDALDILKRDVIEKFVELKIYNEDAIKNFIYSIEYEKNPKYKELFHKYLKSIKCKLNFYEIFDEQIKDVKKKLEERNNKDVPYSEVLDLFQKREDEIRPKRYKLIFPSCQFESFSLGDRSNNLNKKMNEEYHLLNTCHIQIYISNNAINKSIEISKEPFIIRFDYCYIDNEGNKIENKYYIDNETTRNCQSGIEYFEKDYYNMWAIKREKFKISSIINNEVDNSFISILAEYKHGINDYTIKDKQLVKLSAVLDEIQQLTDNETGFSIGASESERCLKICLINEQLKNNEFVETLLTNKLPKIKKSRKSPIKKVAVKPNKPIDDDKVTRSEIYKQKVLKKSENAINVINFVSSRENVTAQCYGCGYEWKIRSDHLLSRPYCPLCRKMNNKIFKKNV